MTSGRLIVLAGLPGAGKTTAANWLAAEHHVAIASRDTIRAAMFPQCEFSLEEKDAAFAAMKAAIVTMLGQGRTVVTDGITFSSRSDLASVIAIGRSADVPVTLLHLILSVQLAQDRVEHDRKTDPNVPADRDAELVAQVAKRFDPLPPWAVEIDSSAPIPAIRAALVRALELET